MTVMDEYHALNNEWEFFTQKTFDCHWTETQMQPLIAQTWQRAQAQVHKHAQMYSHIQIPVFFYDTETIDNTTNFCAMGASYAPHKGFQAFGNIPKRLAFLPDASSHYRRTEPNLAGDALPVDSTALPIIWGANAHEKHLLANQNISKYMEVQKLVSKRLNTAQSVNIATAEQEIIPWFSRQSCDFWKHKKDWFDYFDKRRAVTLISDQMFFSLARQAQGLPFRRCKICGKAQDVLLYCLEDALASFFLFAECMKSA